MYTKSIIMIALISNKCKLVLSKDQVLRYQVGTNKMKTSQYHVFVIVNGSRRGFWTGCRFVIVSGSRRGFWRGCRFVTVSGSRRGFWRGCRFVSFICHIHNNTEYNQQ